MTTEIIKKTGAMKQDIHVREEDDGSLVMEFDMDDSVMILEGLANMIDLLIDTASTQEDVQKIVESGVKMFESLGVVE